MKTQLALTATLVSIICSSSNGINSLYQPANIATTPVTGTINGKPFVLGSALAQRTKGVKGVVLNIKIASQGVTLSCGGADPRTVIMATTPAAVGSYDAKYGYGAPISPGHFIFTFPMADDSSYNLDIGALVGKIEGYIRIDSIDSSQIHGGIYSKATRKYQDKDYNAEVSGEFTAAFCP